MTSLYNALLYIKKGNALFILELGVFKVECVAVFLYHLLNIGENTVRDTRLNFKCDGYAVFAQACQVLDDLGHDFCRVACHHATPFQALFWR